MGYTKIVQYGDVTEVYKYDRNLSKKPPTRYTAYKLAQRRAGIRTREVSTSLKKSRTDKIRAESKAKGTYTKSKRSIRRSKLSFFRLCHHNIYSASTVHFITLTFAFDVDYKTAARYVAHFFRRIKENNEGKGVRYISVPELTKKGRYHFHILVFDLPARLAGYPLEAYSKKGGFITSERETRNLQRLFRVGFVDVLLATGKSKGIAGYMAKYMGKALADTRYESTRGYNCSRGLDKPTSAGSNSFDFDSFVIPSEDEVELTERKEYDVPYLGKCEHLKIIKIKK